MTDGMDQALADAGLTLLRSDPGLVVFDGSVPNGAQPPYVLVYTLIDWSAGVASDNLDGTARSPTVRWYCHCIGSNAMAARAVAQRVRTQLLNQRPVITDLNLGLIRMDQASPPNRDEFTGLLVMDAVEIYSLVAAS